ncbi:MAG: hypothetical protein ACJ8GO_19690 [Ramlibacter sp.]
MPDLIRHPVVATSLVVAVAWAHAATPDWRAAPGSDDIEIAIDSVDMQGSRVAALLRAPMRAIRMAADARVKTAARVVVLADFDCAARTVQPLSVVIYGRGDSLLSSSGIPGAPVPLQWGDPLLSAYDALCDLARERR